MVQQSNSWASIRGKAYFEELHAFQCSKRHYLQQPRLVSNLTDEWIKNTHCGAMAFFTKLELKKKKVTIHIETQKTLNRQSSLEKEEWNWRNQPS